MEEPTYNMYITMPTLARIRDTMRRKIITHSWHNESIDPTRAGMRPSFSDLYGEGSTLTMPLAASWLSSGPGACEDDTNIVAFPKGVDRSFVQYMQSIGVLGKHSFVDFQSLSALANRTSRLIYSVDELPEEWDSVSANTARAMRLVNTKKELHALSNFPVPYVRADLQELASDMQKRIGSLRALKNIHQIIWERYRTYLYGVLCDPSRPAMADRPLYIKLNNTEASGIGVFRCDSADDFKKTIVSLREKALLHDLDTEIVIQPKVDGKNKSFQYILNPGEPHRIQLLTLSEQFIADDGVTYVSSINAPIFDKDISSHLAVLMTNMARHIQAIDLDAFGCVMCDYFELKDGKLLAFDPGLRPTGNTATAIARLLIQEQAGSPMHSTLFCPETTKRETPFKTFIQPLGALMGPDAAAKDGCCVLPWGYNHIQGRGLFIGVAKTREELENLVQDTTATLVNA